MDFAKALEAYKAGKKIMRQYGKVLYIDDDKQNYIKFTQEDVLAEDWKILEQNYNWSKLIERKCLCKFWTIGKDNNYSIDLLAKYEPNAHKFKFTDAMGKMWEHCEPLSDKNYSLLSHLDDKCNSNDIYVYNESKK